MTSFGTFIKLRVLGISDGKSNRNRETNCRTTGANLQTGEHKAHSKRVGSVQPIGKDTKRQETERRLIRSRKKFLQFRRESQASGSKGKRINSLSLFFLILCSFEIFLIGFAYVKPSLLTDNFECARNSWCQVVLDESGYYQADQYEFPELLTHKYSVINIMSFAVLLSLTYCFLRVGNYFFKRLRQ